MTEKEFNNRYHILTQPGCNETLDIPVNGTERQVVEKLLDWTDEQLRLMDLLILKTNELN